MGNIFSKYYLGEKRDYRKFNIIKCFCHSLFVLIGEFIKNGRSIFSWCNDSGGFNRILVDNSCSV